MRHSMDSKRSALPIYNLYTIYYRQYMHVHDFIFTVTKRCNYQCSYCNFNKSNDDVQDIDLTRITHFLNRNHTKIRSFKFFWWEPLLVFHKIKTILDGIVFENKIFTIVTNASLIRPDMVAYFERYFNKISLSIDTENIFNFSVLQELDSLKDRVHFNIIFNPGEENVAKENFLRLYHMGYRNFNLLPVYYTKTWWITHLKRLSEVLKDIVDLKKNDPLLHFSGFQENQWEKVSLMNEALYIDTDLKVYFSDAVDTPRLASFKEKLYIWEIDERFDPDIVSIDVIRNTFHTYNSTSSHIDEGLHRVMDYLSVYLNK